MPRKAEAGTIVFVHANGFPAGTYNELFKLWRQAGWRVLAPPRLGHDPAYPVTSNWPKLRDELLAFVERESPALPVHLVGHSLGGYLSLLAASRKPAWFAGVVLIDSPIVAGWRAHSVHMAKLTGLIGRVTPGRVSQQRRQHWDSADEAHAHYAAKSLFRALGAASAARLHRRRHRARPGRRRAPGLRSRGRNQALQHAAAPPGQPAAAPSARLPGGLHRRQPARPKCARPGWLPHVRSRAGRSSGWKARTCSRWRSRAKLRWRCCAGWASSTARVVPGGGAPGAWAQSAA